MLLRLVLGLLKGGVLGGAIAALLVFGLGVANLTGLFAYLSVMLTSVLVALVAGKPIWARGAWVEVLLKGVAAATLSAGLMYAMQRYLPGEVAIGATPLSQLPLFYLPSVAMLLAIFFEIDNDDTERIKGAKATSDRVRVDDTSSAELSEQDNLEDEVEPRSRQARS
jgi:hypothetical protein